MQRLILILTVIGRFRNRMRFCTLLKNALVVGMLLTPLIAWGAKPGTKSCEFTGEFVYGEGDSVDNYDTSTVVANNSAYSIGQAGLVWDRDVPDDVDGVDDATLWPTDSDYPLTYHIIFGAVGKTVQGSYEISEVSLSGRDDSGLYYATDSIVLDTPTRMDCNGFTIQVRKDWRPVYLLEFSHGKHIPVGPPIGYVHIPDVVYTPAP